MKTKIFLSILFLVLLYGHGLFAQAQQIDSLLNVLKTAKEDTGKANLLNQLASLHTYSDPEKSFSYSTAALVLAQKLESKIYIAQSYQNMSVYYFNTGNPQRAMECIKKTIPILEQTGDKHSLGDAYGNMSNGAYVLNDYYGAFAWSKKALELSEEIHDSARIAEWLEAIGNNYRDITSDYNLALTYLFRSLKMHLAGIDPVGLPYNYFNIASVYSMEHNDDKASEYFTLALRKAEANNNKLLVADCLNRMGNISYTKKDFDKATEYFTRALKISDDIKSYAGSLEANDGLAKVYTNSGKFNKALENENEALKVAEQLTDKYAISSVYTSYGDIYLKIPDYNKASDYLKKALALAREIGRKDVQRDIYGRLAECSKLTNNYKAAYEYQNEYSKLNDSIAGEQTLKKTAELQVRFDSEKKDNEIVVLNKDKELQALEIKKQKLLKYSFIGGLAALILISVFLFNTISIRNKLKLQTLRNKIASDLHDDVGSTLSSIAIFSEVAQQQSKEVIPMLDTIGESARKMLDAMADIVWTINPENDQFEKIILRMRSFAYELLGAKKIEFEFNANEGISKKKLPMSVRKNLYLIFKEATNNLAKYSDATKASFTIKDDKNKLNMLIRDNGKGFDAAREFAGNGLKNMKRRADEIGAMLLIDSRLDEGTTINLLIDIS